MMKTRLAVSFALCTLLAGGGLAQPVKTMVLDDFTSDMWSVTLQFGASISNNWFNLDRRHCIFGERQSWTDINTNPNHTTLTISIGNHEQRLSSPLQVGWHHEIQYGNNGTTDVDLSCVDRFMVDFTTDPPGTGPDSMTLSVHDKFFRSGTVGMNGRIGGVYFRKSNFPANIDWKHITYVSLLQNFNSLPNPTLYSVTNFYATIKPGVAPPAGRIDPLTVFNLP